jgi:hypothetical protein
MILLGCINFKICLTKIFIDMADQIFYDHLKHTKVEVKKLKISLGAISLKTCPKGPIFLQIKFSQFPAKNISLYQKN